MASSTYHTICIYSQNGADRVAERIQEDEAGTTIVPGYLIEYDSSEELVPHATSSGVQGRMIAVENPYDDDNTSAAIDSSYADGNTARFMYGLPGEIYYMYLATGNNAVKGVSRLLSNGDGSLQVATVDASTLATAVVGVPEEDLNNTSGSNSRLRVRLV